MNQIKHFLMAFFVFTSFAQAATVAIIDSGTDMDHTDLKAKAWVNPDDVEDAVDNDDNGYIDDINGWNFADQDYRLIEKNRFQGKFSKDIFNYFNVQSKMLTKQATEDDKTWLKSKKEDAVFLGELQTFGNYIHGTHVSGIALKDASHSKLMGIKILPTKSRVPDLKKRSNQKEVVAEVAKETASGIREKILKKFLKTIAKKQGDTLGLVGDYLADHPVEVANCSFGTSHTMVKSLIEPLVKFILGSRFTTKKLDEYASYFIEEGMKTTHTTLIKPSPGTLFVMAAGNDGTDNDKSPASPANIKSHNTITVAATYGTEALAVFSNYGAETVEVAAPGVNILSTAPGNGYFKVSGTSQAAPYVSNVAALMLEKNSALSAEQVKYIIMKTVDVKPFLAGKVKTSGIVNKERAVLAASFSAKYPVDHAIDMALGENVPDFVSSPLAPAPTTKSEAQAVGFLMTMQGFY